MLTVKAGTQKTLNRGKRPDICDSFICEAGGLEAPDQVAELLKQCLSIEDNAEVTNEVIGDELEDEDGTELLKAAPQVRDLDQEPDAETIVIDQIKKQAPNLTVDIGRASCRARECT